MPKYANIVKNSELMIIMQRTTILIHIIMILTILLITMITILTFMIMLKTLLIIMLMILLLIQSNTTATKNTYIRT